MSLVSEAKAAATAARTEALHGAEAAVPAAHRAEELATRMGSVLTRLQELGAEVDGIASEHETDVALPAIEVVERSRTSSTALGNLALGSGNENLHAAVASLDRAVTASGIAEEAIGAVRNHLEGLCAILMAAAGKAEATLASMYGSPTPDAPYGVMSSTVVAGERMLEGVNKIDDYLPVL